MATVGNMYPTLSDLKKQEWGDDIATIIDMLVQFNAMYEDAPVLECNMGTSHLTTVRTGLPTPTWRKLYKGVLPTKGTTAQVKDATGMLEDWSEVDAKLVEIAKNPAKFRLNEAKAHIAGMANMLGSTVYYGDIDVNPERFTGLHARFNSKTAGNGKQIVDAGGTGSNNTSIWFVTWGEDSVHLLYPEGTKAGLQRDDKGKTTKELPDGSLYDVYREKFSQDIGLSVRDWRGVARIANIDVTALRANSNAGGADLINLMIDGYYALQNPNQPNGKTVIYAPKTVQTFLHKQAMNKTNVNLTLDQSQGKPVVSFLGLPIRRDDNILETEGQIV
ncbi:major capsid protein [Agrobacterium cavarae]|uniref:major capsid protein n=1 Tax=Agrobacterium cavarae TaxID=2528239 RepID=UPI002FFB6CE1